MLLTSPFPLSNKTPNEILVTHSVINGIPKYIVTVPRGMSCEHGFRWCYENLPAHTWIQYREYIEKLDVNGYKGISWATMKFEFEDSKIAVEFALRFS
jgi:hypothetical protein